MLRIVRRLSALQKQMILVGVDLSLVPISLILAYLLQHGTAEPLTQLQSTLPIIAILLLFGAAFSSVLGIPRTKLNAFDIGGVGKAAVFTFGLTVCAFFLGSLAQQAISDGVYVVFGLIYFLAIVSARIAMLKFVLILYQKDKTRTRVLIYGAGTTGLQLAQALKTHGSIVPVAFADDNSVLQGRYIGSLPVIKPGHIAKYARERDLDRVLLAMPSLSQPKQTQIARRLENEGMEVQSLPSFSQLIGQETLVDKFAPVLPGAFLGRAQFNDGTLADEVHFSDQTVLITGAGGSIGSELCRQILACRPKRLVLYELSELALYAIDNELRDLTEKTDIQIVAVLGSVTDGRLAKKVLADNDVDVVVHAAAYKHVPLVEANPLVGLANNVLGTATLARAALEAEVERFILISSDKAVRPANVMGASKRLAELVIQDMAERSEKTVFAMVRFGNVLGSSGSVIPLFQDQIARGGPVTLTHPNVNRFFMTVQEAVRLVIRATTFAKGGEVFVLDMGQPILISKLARQMIEFAGYSVRDANNPDGDIEIVVTGLRPGEKLNEELLIGEGHLTTQHEKIFAAREAHLSEIEVASALRSLRSAVASADEPAALAVLARWVEGWTNVRPTPATNATTSPAGS